MIALPTTHAASSPNEPTTSQYDESSDATDHGSTNTTGNSWTRLLHDIDLTKLSPTSQATKILIGDQLPNGYAQTELATKLGLSPSSITNLVNGLRNELLLTTGRFFPHTDQEYAALKASIALHGIQVPVVLGLHIRLIDGRTRWLIAEELGLTEIPAVLLTGTTPEMERQIAISLNVNRRQLNQAQRRSLIHSELMRDPGRSDNLIATICGTTNHTVAAVRAEIVQHERMRIVETPPSNLPTHHERETTPHAPTAPRTRSEPQTRVNALGRHEAAPAARTARSATGAANSTPLGYADCTHGTKHTVIRTPTGYRLEPA